MSELRSVIYITEADADLKNKVESIVASTSKKIYHNVPYVPLESSLALAQLTRILYEHIKVFIETGNPETRGILSEYINELDVHFHV
jgi:hypothetical protein